LLILLCVSVSCSHRKTILAAQAPPPPVHPTVGAVEIGIASWYGDPYHGRQAASGEIFDKEKLTAAHRSLPFQTWVEVTNLENGKRVTVRINDRGPFIAGRIIDLSQAAGREIDLVRLGIARVRLVVIRHSGDPNISSTGPALPTANTAPDLFDVIADKHYPGAPVW
jgi:rare lipoprotein A